MCSSDANIRVLWYLMRWRSGLWMPSHNCCYRRGSQTHHCFWCQPFLPANGWCDTSYTAGSSWFSIRRVRKERKKERMLSQPWQSLTTLFLFSYLFVLGQTLCVAQSFAAAVHLQHERLVVAVGAAVGTAGHGQVVYCTETVEAGVTAELVDGTGQDHLMFALQDGWQKKSVLFQKMNPSITGAACWRPVCII